ncbi:hypothetical protein V1477_019612 [Vespula maculifrons]|uniref:Uncharacterized protein n=1 Tax=Vespula maculifrons TaxID=7453 RepID=A0ABD2ARJ9_VESMC
MVVDTRLVVTPTANSNHLSLLPGVSVNKRITAVPSFWFYPASVLLYSLRLVPTYRCSDIYGKMETFEKNESSMNGYDCKTSDFSRILSERSIFRRNIHTNNRMKSIDMADTKDLIYLYEVRKKRAVWDRVQQPMGETKAW